MEKLWIVTIAGLLFAAQSQAQTSISEEDLIKQVVKTFSRAGDQQNADLLGTTLHEDYRIVWNDLQAATVKVIDRATYLSLIEQKKFGGDERRLSFEGIDVHNGNTATVKLKMIGAKATFLTFLSLVKAEGEWMIVQDLVMMEAN